MESTLQQQRNGQAAILENALIYFILLQPILDITAYFELPFSEIIRVLAMGVGFVYILMQPNSNQKRHALIYLMALALFMVIHLLINVFEKNPFHFMMEITYIIKTAFFAELLIVYAFVIHSFSKRENGQETIQRLISINMAVIAIVMLLAAITDTGNRTYGALAKEGHSGWFFSGNELSTIMALGFPVMMLLLIKRRTLAAKLAILPFIALVIWSMLTIGTKVGFGALLMILGVAIIVSVVEIIQKKKWHNAMIVVPLFLITILVTPYTPVGNNLNFFMGTDGQKSTEEQPTEQEDPITPKPHLLSGRSDFLQQIQEQYRAAPVTQKAFGMGYGGNFKTDPKLVEMDVLDWFFNFGFIGLIILLIPLIYFAYRILFGLIYTRFKNLDVPMIFTGLAICLGLGSAFVAGHVLSSPASSIYLAILIGYLLVSANFDKNRHKHV